MKKPLQEKPRLKPRLAHSHPRDVAISTSSDMSAPDTKQPIFDPGMDVATVLFSHVRCVKTRVNLTLVSKLWREASKPAAAYPRTFDSDAFPESWSRQGEDILNPPRNHRIRLLDNDEALSLPYERVVGLLGEAFKNVRTFEGTSNSVCNYAAQLGSVRLLKWARVNNLGWTIYTCSYAAYNGHLPALQYLHENGCPWNTSTCYYAAKNGHLFVLQYLHENGCPWDSSSSTCKCAAQNGHLPALKYLHENGCPWNEYTCLSAAIYKHWDCLQYAVDNKCPGWERYAEKYACACAAHTKRWDRLQYLVDNKSPGWKEYVHNEHLRYFYAGSGYGSDDSQASM
jgi:hypothetical protein